MARETSRKLATDVAEANEADFAIVHDGNHFDKAERLLESESVALRCSRGACERSAPRLRKRAQSAERHDMIGHGIAGSRDRPSIGCGSSARGHLSRPLQVRA
jgi:hypothetical protein